MNKLQSLRPNDVWQRVDDLRLNQCVDGQFDYKLS